MFPLWGISTNFVIFLSWSVFFPFYANWTVSTVCCFFPLLDEYVICNGCKSPDTILSKENRLFFLRCEQVTWDFTVSKQKQFQTMGIAQRPSGCRGKLQMMSNLIWNYCMVLVNKFWLWFARLMPTLFDKCICDNNCKLWGLKWGF